jgi:hypothetical protein
MMSVHNSAILTFCAFLPACFAVLFGARATRRRFLYLLSVSSLSFYLFSFQVHEKSILLAVLPISLLYVVNQSHALAVTWFSTIATFSMYPLIYKEGLVLPYIVLQCIFVATGVSLSSAVSSSIKYDHNNNNDDVTATAVVTDRPSNWLRYAFVVTQLHHNSYHFQLIGVDNT